MRLRLAYLGVAGERRAFRLSYATNLLLNAGWTAVFFAARRPTAALAEIAALNASNMALVRRAWLVDRVAGAALAVPGVDGIRHRVERRHCADNR